MEPCSAHSGAAVLFKFYDVLVAAAQQRPRLVRRFRRTAGLNAYDAVSNIGTAIHWCGCLFASRQIGSNCTAMTMVPCAAGRQVNYGDETTKVWMTHDVTSTVDQR
jgi:hypothetical protein